MIIQVHESPDANSPRSRVWEPSEVSSLRRDGVDGDKDLEHATWALARRGYRLLLRNRFATGEVAAYVCAIERTEAP